MKINPTKIIEDKLIYPAPGQSDLELTGDNNQLQQNGIDLRVQKIELIRGNAELYIDKSKNLKPNFMEIPLNENCFLLYAGEQYAITFMEDVTVPSGMCARVIHRSTVNRTIGTIWSAHYDTGFESVGGCGATFRPRTNVKIEKGTRLAQIIFETAEEASSYNGQYQKQ